MRGCYYSNNYKCTSLQLLKKFKEFYNQIMIILVKRAWVMLSYIKPVY